jgi:hypothetical protein
MKYENGRKVSENNYEADDADPASISTIGPLPPIRTGEASVHDPRFLTLVFTRGDNSSLST